MDGRRQIEVSSVRGARLVVGRAPFFLTQIGESAILFLQRKRFIFLYTPIQILGRLLRLRIFWTNLAFSDTF